MPQPIKKSDKYCQLTFARVSCYQALAHKSSWQLANSNWPELTRKNQIETGPPRRVVRTIFDNCRETQYWVVASCTWRTRASQEKPASIVGCPLGGPTVAAGWPQGHPAVEMG